VDRVTGGRSDPITVPFNLTRADILDCEQFGLLVRGALGNVNHRINRNTGDSRAVYNGMRKANALVRARPPPFCDPDFNPGSAGARLGNVGGQGGGQGSRSKRRRLHDEHLTEEQRSILEGLETVLVTLEVRGCGCGCVCACVCALGGTIVNLGVHMWT